MDSYGIFHPGTHLQTPNSSFWTPKTSNFGFRASLEFRVQGLGGIFVKLFLSVLISATVKFSSSVLKSLVTHLATPT